MSKSFRIVRSHDEITLVSRQRGRTFVALLALEIVLAAAYLAILGTVEATALEFALPLVACVAVAAWTASYIQPDMRLTLNLADRTARVVRISPLTGRRTAAMFSLDDLEGLELRPVGRHQGSGMHIREYAIDVAVRGGGRHELRVQGALMACRDTLDQFRHTAGLTTVPNLGLGQSLRI